MNIMNQGKPSLDPHPLSEYVAWAGARNREPILNVLKEKLPKEPGVILEIASGSGMHINYFAPHFKHLFFQPSDYDTEVFDNIKNILGKLGNDNVYDPLSIDLTQPKTWLNLDKKNGYSAIFCINIFHVAPIDIIDGMMECAAELLNENGFLFIYGPFKVDGTFNSASNEQFNETLNSTGVPEWGLKDIADLKKVAEYYDLKLQEKIDMPSNNFSLIFARK
ncbi:MAG: class I SAM-dependent methyltransferase [Trichodesmium sp. MAG_R04]|nr:class I SAM-dependent methyltransferase [Trichodesmium sp. MAG_R04]